ncbi:MAG TPA: DUF2884 family protein [Pseudoxanthomonas sp.]|nr:DUF2884 family protein [Pseudoxanthomonas sp.]
MKTIHSPLLALFMAALLCSCNPGTSVSTDSGRITANSKSVTLRVDGLPSAEITATGDLNIGGKAVTVSASQRALLQTYHREMNAMTADGIAIGKQGASLAGKAVTETIKGAISGNTDDIEGKVEAETKKIEQQAMQLCKRLVTIKTSQDALAISLPEFKPYATLDQSDVDDCGSSQNESYSAGKEVGGSLAKAVKGDHPQDIEAADSGDAAAQADAAGASESSTR